MTRAVLEGVAFGLKDIFTLIQNAGLGAIVQVRASGGGIKSPLWRQILASVLEADLITVDVVEGAAYGAALLAGVGTGVWSNVATACKEVVRLAEITKPNEGQVVIYRIMYPIYRELYPELKSTFQKME
jgi:xylulokinase